MKQHTLSTGKRKTAIAKAVIKKGRGRIRINRTPLEIYEPELARLKIFEPLQLSGLQDKVDINVTVNGGGVMGQAEAVRTAIGKVLIDYSNDKELRDMFYEYDRTLVKNDPRRKEPKKYGGRGARAKKQKSYR
ncbi:MAG TPA: 30S ribosomal protein S9 [Euryarchaeota archaeon]|nr:30S ribosomal protein S9 [archaeon BMS3Abin16]GBE57081.1 30S ribosomal protein S9 [archaeon BMS3Bbin16]HDH28285.1 30S ribosomal protein S9 [Euryarchaeota archaeon]HDY74166.1 30S ribosomal protein S9 [Euryarchaeota archaeon]